MFYAPETASAVPLVVALHTWSGNYKQKTHEDIEQWCGQVRWAYLHPNFRGPNRRPEATGSELVVKDILSAVDYAKQETAIDESSVYLVGTSGGGYGCLLMAGRHPKMWAGVSAWVPIADLRAWYLQCDSKNLKYAEEIVASCGGAPGDSAAVDQQYRNRSPLTYLARAKGLALHINAGVRDGHTGSVPISHSLLAFNAVADPQDRIGHEDIRRFVSEARVPDHLRRSITDSSYGEKQPLFRRTSGEVTVTIFDGGHELIPSAAIHWIETIHKDRYRTSR
jgi:poly(3-hydroxybutyrate) depolymerase